MVSAAHGDAPQNRRSIYATHARTHARSHAYRTVLTRAHMFTVSAASTRAFAATRKVDLSRWRSQLGAHAARANGHTFALHRALRRERRVLVARASSRDACDDDGTLSAVNVGGDDAATNGPREDLEFSFGADYGGDELMSQGEAVVKGVSAVADKPSGLTLDVDYLQELIAIQQDCPKDIGFFGTRNMGFLHQQLIEILSYALCLTGNHIYTSGATGTNAAVIRGALRAEQPELLTVVLPQSLSKQPRESRELLESVTQIIEAPENDDMPLVQASRICNDTIVSKVKQVIVFAFHDSRLLLDTCRQAKSSKKLVTLFFLD